ncbi:hypothetical protein A1Q2_02877 [Trichosporon asahii var. asahii CBS 8904]|uniref:Uncharacterized protein n=1 Tax=Trichosporon asahii var. asahii (strain CBS 8904) TaxID=1220162 RepID=K1VTB1_TRIAC|nr:hypothetical protein A1Q2_02877 [Trichosporon asahii var. asahii CBS 8904]
MSSRSSATPRSNLSEYQSRRASSSATPINPFKPAIKAARTKSPQQPAAGPFSGMRRGEPMAVKAEPFTQAATPLSSGHPSSASSSATPVSPAPLQPRRTVSSATPGGSAKLEEHPRERLQSWLNKYMEEKMAILEQRLSGGDSDEDPEMADMKLGH